MASDSWYPFSFLQMLLLSIGHMHVQTNTGKFPTIWGHKLVQSVLTYRVIQLGKVLKYVICC